MDMFVKQLSVFIENREGRLEQVTEVLKEENTNTELPQCKLCLFWLQAPYDGIDVYFPVTPVLS